MIQLEGGKVGRPPTDIDADMVRKLANLGCNQDEIADFFGVTQSVICERFRSDFHRNGLAGFREGEAGRGSVRAGWYAYSDLDSQGSLP
jgi:hypothetical protein